MVADHELNQYLKANPPAKTFVPYCHLQQQSDTLTVYFARDADYAKRLNDHITLYLSLATHEIVGCRIKGIADILRAPLEKKTMNASELTAGDAEQMLRDFGALCFDHADLAAENARLRTGIIHFAGGEESARRHLAWWWGYVERTVDQLAGYEVPPEIIALQEAIVCGQSAGV